MSRHHPNAEIQISEEKPTHHRRSHCNHLHLKPTSVLKNLKIKVKRKRLLRQTSLEVFDDTSNPNINNSNNQRLSEEQNESDTSPSKHSLMKTDEANEQDSVISNEINLDENLRKQIQSKPTKSLLETNVKKRRQTVRRIGFQIRSEDFNIIFSDLPSSEQLIIAFPCAWRKDVFMHGRMFLSLNYLSFYTCLFKWEESLCIAYTDIVSVTREKSVKVVPNAIKLRTKNQEQYLFACSSSREKVFIAIFRSWQNALLEQPFDYQRLRARIYADQQSHDEGTGDSEESAIVETNSQSTSQSGLLSQSFPVTSNYSIDSPVQPKPSSRSHRRIVSFPSKIETITYLPTCSCENHLTKTFADRLFTLNVDTLFELICGDNSFTNAFHNSQKLTDYTYGEWRFNTETGKRERQVTYKTITQSILGTNILFCREKQILEEDKPHLMYVVNTEVYNEGMKYTDAFYVATRFCMVQQSIEHSSLRVTGEIKYIKNVNGFIKGFIEKNAHSSVEGGVNDQVRRLESQQVDRKSISKQHQKKSTDKTKYQKQMRDDDFSVNSIGLSKNRTMIGNEILYDILILIGICLLCLHLYLCYKFYMIDQILMTSDEVHLN